MTVKKSIKELMLGDVINTSIKVNNTWHRFPLVCCGLSEDKDSALLLSECLLPQIQMNNVNIDRYDGCYVDTFLSSNFKNSISHELNQSLVKTRMQDRGDCIRREIFLPSSQEIACRFRDALICNVGSFSSRYWASAHSLLSDTGLSRPYWLRTPHHDLGFYYITYNGNQFVSRPYECDYWLRPCFSVSLDTIVLSEEKYDGVHAHYVRCYNLVGRAASNCIQIENDVFMDLLLS